MVSSGRIAFMARVGCPPVEEMELNSSVASARKSAAVNGTQSANLFGGEVGQLQREDNGEKSSLHQQSF